MPATIYEKGDSVQIEHEGRTVDGTITLASPNGKSLILAFEAMLGGHVGQMPVTMRDDGLTGYSIIDGTEVRVRKMVLQ